MGVHCPKGDPKFRDIYLMKSSGKMSYYGIVHVVSLFMQHFMLYLGILDYLLDGAYGGF